MISSLWPEKARWLKFLVAFLLLVYAIIESIGSRNDWDIFLAASRALFEGADIYVTTYFDGYHYYYSILFASLLYPFTLMPPVIAKFIWIGLNMLMIGAILKRVMKLFDDLGMSIQHRRWIFLLIFLGSFRFLKSNLHLGQTTILLLFLSLEALHQDQQKKPVLAGLLLSLAINIKLLPAVIIPYFIYRARWRSAIFASIMVVGWLLFPLSWLGVDRTSALMHSYVELINPAQARHILDVEEPSFHGLSTFISTLFSAQAHEPNGAGWKRNIADVSMDTLSSIILYVRLFFILLTLYFLRTVPFKSATNDLHRAWELSYLLLVIPLIAPHQQHYAFLFATPAIAYVSYCLLSYKGRRIYSLRIAFAFVLVTFNLALWLGVFNTFYNHYKILTYGALMLVVLLTVLIPPGEKQKVGTSPTFQ
jgi:hypothetical protein